MGSNYLAVLFFWLLMYLTFSFSEMNIALVAGIDFEIKNQSNCQITEVMYFNGTSKICHSAANYPEDVFEITGGSFLNNSLIFACGGGYPLTSACYFMSNDLKWKFFANLTQPKYGTASVVIRNGLLVTGT